MGLRNWRLSQGMTQEQLGKQIGVCRRTVVNNERRLTNEFIGKFHRKYPDDVREITGEADVQGTEGRLSRSMDGDLPGSDGGGGDAERSAAQGQAHQDG